MLWSFTVNPVFDSALGKPNLLIDPVGFTPIGAEIEGLIHTARCLTGNSIELLAPAVGGPAWPGGLSSPFITPPYGKCLRQMRCRLTLFCPSECRAQLHCYRRRPPMSSCFWRSLKNICFRSWPSDAICAAPFQPRKTARRPKSGAPPIRATQRRKNRRRCKDRRRRSFPLRPCRRRE